MFFSNTETSLRHKGNAEWLGKRKISSETSLVGGTFCHHCHKPDKDHEDTECRGAILRQGNEVKIAKRWGMTAESWDMKAKFHDLN